MRGQLLLFIFSLSFSPLMGQTIRSSREKSPTKKNKDVFQVIDNLTEKQKKFERSLIIKPEYKPPRYIGDPPIFIGQVVEGSLAYDVLTGEEVRFPKATVVNAKLTSLGSQRVFILNKDKKVKYETSALNVLNVERTTSIKTDIDPLIIYTDQPKFNATEEKMEFSHFFSLSYETIQSDYYSKIFRGVQDTAEANSFEMKNYFISESFPINAGFSIGLQRGIWTDEEYGSFSWFGIFLGPSFMTTFWEKENSRWNAHLNIFQSLHHQANAQPDRTLFSTLGLKLDIEREFDTRLGAITLGLSTRYAQSSVLNTSEYLENTGTKGSMLTFGGYLSYRFNWSYE